MSSYVDMKGCMKAMISHQIQWLKTTSELMCNSYFILLLLLGPIYEEVDYEEVDMINPEVSTKRNEAYGKNPEVFTKRNEAYGRL